MPDTSHTRDFIIRNLRRGGIFLAIGGLGFVVDAIVYNLLVFSGGMGPLHAYPLVAKTIAVIAGLVVTYVGNKLLTYRDRKAPVSWAQVLRYGVVNVLAILVQLGCLGFSRYVLGLDSVLADNISGTLIGQALATGLRYVLYTLWVFPHSPGQDPVTYIEVHHEAEPASDDPHI
ncbi:GtrA family protein [Microbacterium trichothecenolyticum]|uniref:GtrA family protein n=1 Tax=Microbacterium trichothecenolyticum TaxID=69370 RepID=UPI001C6ED02B|nr:GtrA family protein [Microbacterium trichothecenolyticum]MBW9119444.1 GtrA family protein [Microbacterium trichothecenolyticum]